MTLSLLPETEVIARGLRWEIVTVEQALGPVALLAVQPGCLRIEPYQLVPVVRALRMSRARLLLADTIDTAFPNEAWFPGLADARRPEVKQLHQGKTVEDFDTRLTDCTTLSDKATIIRKAPDLTQQVGLPSLNHVTRQFKMINSLRNRLFHGLAPLTEECDTLRDHLDHGQQLTKARDVIWLASVVSTMNTWIEALAPLDMEDSDDGA